MDNLLTCKIDGEAFPSEKELHKHIRKHSLRLAEYYQKYHPRYDLHDNKIIKFKNKEYYFSHDFNSKTSLKAWLKSQPQSKAKEYCVELLKKRKEEKELIYSPSQVELRSIMSPPIQYYNELFGWDGYYKLCSKLEFKNKYKIFNDIVSGAEYNKPEYKIYVDTREQKPLKFNRPIEVKTLKFGDYAFSSSQASCGCHIERKSLTDLIGTISGGYERFHNEIKRAQEAEAYLVVLVEEKINNALAFNFLPHISRKIKATPDFIFHRIRTLIQRYPHIQFLFVDGRKESSRVMERIFTCGGVYKQVDLQLAYDLKIL